MPHIHEKVDFTVEVFIVYKNKVLLRMHDKHKVWLSVGGHIELDEDPIEAAMREVKEEVGLDVEIIGGEKGIGNGDEENCGYIDLIPPKYLGMHPATSSHKHIVFVYFAKAKNDILLNSVMEHERSETKWLDLLELRKINLPRNVRFYAEEALKELGEK
ncbi:MAG: NUDIX domain-containing protein [Burkholderiales bacterium]|nr:NUDIX domain-containing protein [Burkholderiales bacterium]